MPDYSKYCFSWKEKVLCFGLGVLLTGVIAWLFYKSVYAVVLFPVLFLGVIKKAVEGAFFRGNENRIC